MHIKDYARAEGWFRKHAAAPSSKGAWKAFVARNKMAQEPRTMAQEPRNMYAGGQLVTPSVDGSRPGYYGKKGMKQPNKIMRREYPSEGLDEFADAVLDSYAKDDITKIADRKYASNINRVKINKFNNLDKLIKKTGLDEETIFNLFNDREAYLDLEFSKEVRTGRPVEKGKAKFYKQAENWIVKNSKRYADPDKFKKAFVRTFGKDNHLIQTINKGILKGTTRSMTSTPFSDWFRTNILGTSEQAMRGQVKPSYNVTQLNNIFKTAIYTNNENVRNKIINELTDILPEKGSKRIPDIREKFRNSPILKKFGLNQKIEGPIARLLAKEVGDDLLKQVSLFRKPWLGTPELITYLKDRVDPKYKSMFEETSKAVKYAQKNQWPEAKKALNISESIMFDHKIPKALIELGYADDIEYIKVNPTSAEFNARIKNTQFDKPMVKLANQWEKAKTVDAKSKVVGEMNTLKDNFSKKYGNYLDDVKINVDKTGKPIFSSKTPIVTKQTDLVKSLTTSLQHEKFPTMNKTQQHKFLKEAGFNIDKCLSEGGRVKLKLGKGVNTCITGVIDEELKLAKKSGNTAKFTRFGKLARGAGYLVGWVDIPIELAFALPHLLAGNVQDAKAATTAGLFGYGGKKLAQIDQEKNPEAYKYFKHVQDINNWMDAFNQQQDAQSKWDNVDEEYLKKYKTEGDPSGVMDRIVDQYDEAVAKQENTAENYKGYVNEEGEEDLRLIDLGKEEGKKYLRETVKKDWEKGMPIRREPFSKIPYNWAPYKEDKITSLEQQIKQKGESFYGGFMKPGVKAAAERLGAPDLYDDWYDAYYGKDPREAHSSLPLEWTDQLADLEKKELYQALADKLMRPGGAELKESLIEQGFDFEPFREYGLQTTGISRSEGGIASLKKW